MPAASAGNVSAPLLRLFGRLLAEPDRWFAVADLVEEAGASKATVYRRCGELAAARVLSRRRADDQAEFRLHPAWDSSPLGVRLHRRMTLALATEREQLAAPPA